MSDNAANGTCECGSRAAIGVAHVDATPELGVSGGDLMFQLRMSLSKTFGNNVIYEAITVRQRMSWLVTPDTGSRCGLIV